MGFVPWLQFYVLPKANPKGIHETAQRVQPIHPQKPILLTTDDLQVVMLIINPMTSNAPISLLFILLPFVCSYGWRRAEFAWECLISAIYWHQKESKGKFYLRNETLQLLTRTKRKCHGERPKWFADPNDSEALERMLKGVRKHKRVGSGPWRLWF